MFDSFEYCEFYSVINFVLIYSHQKFLGTLMLPKSIQSFDIFPKNKELVYEYHSIVTVGSLPADPDEDSVVPNIWSIDGVVHLQRQVDNFVIAKVCPSMFLI